MIAVKVINQGALNFKWKIYLLRFINKTITKQHTQKTKTAEKKKKNGNRKGKTTVMEDHEN